MRQRIRLAISIAMAVVLLLTGSGCAGPVSTGPSGDNPTGLFERFEEQVDWPRAEDCGHEPCGPQRRAYRVEDEDPSTACTLLATALELAGASIQRRPTAVSNRRCEYRGSTKDGTSAVEATVTQLGPRTIAAIEITSEDQP